MYNLLEYSKNYKKNRQFIEMNQLILFLLILNVLNINKYYRKYFNIGVGEEWYDANKVGKNETEVVIKLKLVKNFSNFWRSLNIPLINCEV